MKIFRFLFISILVFVIFNTNTPRAVEFCATHKNGDADCKDGINLEDFRIFLIEFRRYYRGENFTFTADFNLDQKINLFDFIIWRRSFVLAQDKLNINVLTIGYDPTENRKSIANTYFRDKMGGRTATQVETDSFNKLIQDFADLSENNINFKIVKHISITDFPIYPDGSSFTLENYKKCVVETPYFDNAFCEAQKLKFDYPKWIQTNRICEVAKEVKASEIWMFSNPFIMAWENFMIGPDKGFDPNGGVYTIPNCEKHIIVVNGTYDRSDMLLHNFSHRIEKTIDYITQNWRSEDYNNYWDRFVNFSRYANPTAEFNKVGCGNGHFPRNSSQEYDFENNTKKDFNCKDFSNFPDYNNSSEVINCNTWGCTDLGWQKYWFGFVPRKSGEVEMISKKGISFKFKKNWWYYILYPENTLKLKRQIIG